MAREPQKINGVVHDFSSVEISINGDIYHGVTEINYSTKLSPQKVYGSHSEALGRTRGKREDSCDLTIYEYVWKEMLDKLGDGFMEKIFDIVVIYAEEKDAPLVEDKIKHCRISEIAQSPKEGDEPVKVKLTIDVMRIVYNDKEVLEKPLPAHV
jgi:hypothetical protein